MIPQDWTHPQHPEFTLSTRKDWLDLAAINDAFDSDLVYWNSRQPEDVLRKMLDNSLSLGLYHTSAGGVREQIGLARVVTDEVSFAYLTDFYCLKQFQGKGLGKWTLSILDQTFAAWPQLRRLMFITDSTHGKPFYEKTLPKCHEVNLVSKGYCVMEKLYDGAPKIFQ